MQDALFEVNGVDMLYIIIIAVLAIVDQISKFIVMRSPGMGGQSEIIRNFLYVNVIKNKGVAFGMLEHSQELIIAITAFLAGAILTYILLKRQNERKVVLISLTMIAGGAFGNLIDRIRTGSVTDFIDVHFWPYIFNVADICVVLGCIILLFAVLFPGIGRRRKK